MTMLLIPIIMAIAANGVWTCYNLTALGIPNECAPLGTVANVVNSTGLQGVINVDVQNFPTFPLLIFVTLEVIYFIIYAAQRGRRSYIGVQWLSTMTGVVMIGAGLLSSVYMIPIWAVFLIITSIVHVFDG